MNLQAATKSDIPAIMRVERTDGYARLLGRWEAEQHATELEKPDARTLFRPAEGEPRSVAVASSG